MTTLRGDAHLDCLLLVLLAFALPDEAGARASMWQEVPTDGEGLYNVACASCHGLAGGGVPPDRIAFDVPVPDFTDCSFSSREPDADWITVAMYGGPVRGFDQTMPAYGEALSEEQLQLVMDYIRTFCGDDRWPRGELNLPRPLVTEKAYPEDEAVTTVAINVDGPGSIINELVWERRIGPRSQFELKVPFGYLENSVTGSWEGGIGDLRLGLKHALFHGLESIFSVGFEAKVPTGDDDNGFGSGTAAVEPFMAFGQILPGGAFLHAQAGMEFPFNTEVAEVEVQWRGVLGRSWSQGGYGRTWTPMIELLGEAELENGDVDWSIVPQIQITLNVRQHIMANVGVLVPLTNASLRSTRLMVYLLWDWFDGGFFDGW